VEIQKADVRLLLETRMATLGGPEGDRYRGTLQCLRRFLRAAPGADTDTAAPGPSNGE
jgi:hypothetical protein